MEIKDDLNITGKIIQPVQTFALSSLSGSSLRTTTSNYIRITGTGTFGSTHISSFTKTGVVLTLEFTTTGATIIHDNTYLRLPGGVNITTTAGDKLIIINSLSPTSWDCIGYRGANSRGTNTGDETTATIKTKLGVANNAADGYLTTADWNTFNSKLSGAGGTTAIGNMVLFNSTTGNAIKDSGILVDPSYIDFGVRQIYSDEFLIRQGLIFYNGAYIKDENDMRLLGFIPSSGITKNYIEIGNSSTVGVGPQIKANGIETDIDLNLNTKGDGKLNFNGKEIYIDKYVLKSNQFTITGNGTQQTIDYTSVASTFTNIKQYRIFQKLTSSGNIDIITDTPVYVGTLTSKTFNITTGLEYQYLVVADFNYYTNLKNVNSFTNPSVITYTVDGMLSDGTSAYLSWSTVGSGTTYKIYYSTGTTLSSTPSIATTTNTNITLSGLTASNSLTGVLQYYSFKIEAYNSSNVIIGVGQESNTYLLPLANIAMVYDSTSPVLLVSSINRVGTVATVTTSSNHSLKQGDTISISCGGVAPFEKTNVLVSSVQNLTTFTYTVLDSGATTVSSGITITQYNNPRRVWNYYKFKTALASLEVGSKRIIPRTADIYKNFANYSNELIFPVSKHSFTGDANAGWYGIETKVGAGEKAILMDVSGNSAMIMKRSTYQFTGTPLNQLLYSNDDNRSYKIVHGGGVIVSKVNSGNNTVQDWMSLDKNLTENLGPIYFPNLPTTNAISGSANSVTVANFLVSGYTVYFDNINNRITWLKKDGTGETTVNYSTIGIPNGTPYSSVNSAYFIHDNVSEMTMGQFGNASTNAYRLKFNWNTNTVTLVGAAGLGIQSSKCNTEENSLGTEFMTYFDLDTNTTQIVAYLGGTTQDLYIGESSACLSTTVEFDNLVNTGTYKHMALPTDVAHNGGTQCGMNPVPLISSGGNVYWCDWGHDDAGLYFNSSTSDDRLGLVKMKDMSVHPRLLNII